MSLNRWDKQRDVNERAIIDALEAIHATVEQLDRPCDLLVGFRRKNYLLEVKDGHRKKLTDGQQDFVRRWRGQYAIVTNAEEAVRVVTQTSSLNQGNP